MWIKIHMRMVSYITCKNASFLTHNIVYFSSVVPSHDMQTIFKTPIRAQHPSGDSNEHSTPSRQTLSLFSSPAGSGSCLFTPGRHFVNPFEMDQERLHMPPFSPSLFHVNSATSSAKKADAEVSGMDSIIIQLQMLCQRSFYL